MFIGREKEIAQLEKELSKKSAFVIVYGARRVGKTTLLKHVMAQSPDPTIYFECNSGSLKFNATEFTEKLKGFDIEIKEPDNFLDIFRSLNNQKKVFNVIMDEYPVLKSFERPEFVDSIFQNIVDERLDNIRLFLCGSDISMMKNLNKPNNALFGRCTLLLELKQMNYKEASAFYPDKTPYEKVAYYSVFGGCPFVNEAIDPKKTLKENIKEIFLKKSGIMDIYAQLLLPTGDVDTINELQPLLSILANGRKKYRDLKSKLQYDYDYMLTNRLNKAIELELVNKVYPINKEGDVKKSSYEIIDDALRFYYTYVYSNRSEVYDDDPDEFYNDNIEPSIGTFVSHRFEEICRSYFRQKIKAGEYKSARKVGVFYYDMPNAKDGKRRNGEYDVAVKKNVSGGGLYCYCYDIYEVKYQIKPMTEKDISSKVEDVKAIQGLNIQNIGFISINGFEDDCAELFKGPLIDGEELYR